MFCWKSDSIDLHNWVQIFSEMGFVIVRYVKLFVCIVFNIAQPSVNYQFHAHVLQILFYTIVSSVMSSARSIGLFSDRLQMQPAVPLKFDWMILISHVNLELLPV